jgi:16S rRNA (cytosine967-C5)-methyltransferase
VTTPQTVNAGLSARRLAIYTVDRVVAHSRTLDEAFNEGVSKLGLGQLAGRDRGFARLIATTTLRHLGSLDVLVGGFLDKPLPQDAGRTRFILATAAAQLVHLDTPPHAAISQAVDICRIDHTARRYDRLANAVLRRVAHEGKAIIAGLDTVQMDLPRWLFQRWVAAYGDATARLMGAASLTEAPLDVSVKSDAHGWAEKLAGVALPTGTVRVREAGRIEDLPGFADGQWWVQDAAAALPVRLLDDVAGKRVADLCAAPGGKAAQLATGGAQVVSVDASPKRNVRLKDNMTRLGLTTEIVTADVAAFAADHAGQFDAVLLDAPCSATGTIRRHPDLLHTKQEGDIPNLAVRQREMLTAAMGLLKPGGRLVYATCSLEPDEGEAVVDAVLAAQPAMHLVPVTPAAGIPAQLLTPRGHLRTLPHLALGDDPVAVGMDGFFAVVLERSVR